MNDFQLALIIASVAAVGGVWLYNRWQERGFIDRHAPGGVPPAAAPRVEPRAEPAQEAPDPAPLPVIDEPAVTEDPAPEPPAAGLPDPMQPVDAVIDCIVRFDSPAAISPAALWAAQAGWTDGMSKTLQWMAASPGDPAWTAVGAASSRRYAHWLAALQLVDRRGPVSDAEIGRFFDGLRALAKEFGISIDIPSRSETLLRASQLDEKCAAVDVQFAVHVIHAQGGAFPGTRLRTVCEAVGLELDGRGHFVARNAAGRVEFTLSNLGNEGFDVAGLGSLATHGVVLAIDVPLVADGVAAFDRMVLAARQLAMNLGGILADSQRAPLSDTMIGMIRDKIGELQRDMADVQIPPGGERAFRLFS